jgi:hypothetical protein
LKPYFRRLTLEDRAGIEAVADRDVEPVLDNPFVRGCPEANRKVVFDQFSISSHVLHSFSTHYKPPEATNLKKIVHDLESS